jgi:hypothetical protein
MTLFTQKLSWAENLIGNSYYGWTVSLPKGCRVIKAEPSGKSLLVQNAKMGYYFYIYSVYDRDIQNDEQLLNELLGYVEKEQIVSQGFVQVGDKKWASIVLKSQDEACEYRAYVKNNRIYEIHFYSQRKSEFLNSNKNKKYKEILNSFRLEYKKRNKNIADVNQIKSGFYKYKDKKHGWNILMTPSMNIDIRVKDNVVEILDERKDMCDAICQVEYNPIESGENLEDYYQKEYLQLNQATDGYDLKDTKVGQIMINNLPAKKVMFRLENQEKSCLVYNLFMIAGKYKYHVSLYVDQDKYLNLTEFMYNKIINSFRPPINSAQRKVAGNVASSYLASVEKLRVYFTQVYKKEEFADEEIF